MEPVGVDKIAQVFRISERSVQRLVTIDGMPRDARGKYDLAKCMAWYIRHLHQKVCGCSGPCEGFKPHEREMANARAERKMALKEALDIAPELVGLDADAIEERLTDAVKGIFDSVESVQEEK